MAKLKRIDCPQGIGLSRTQRPAYRVLPGVVKDSNPNASDRRLDPLVRRLNQIGRLDELRAEVADVLVEELAALERRLSAAFEAQLAALRQELVEVRQQRRGVTPSPFAQGGRGVVRRASH